MGAGPSRVTRLVLPDRNVSPVRRDGNPGPQLQAGRDLHPDLPQHRDPLVPSGLGTAQSDNARPPLDRLHLALVIPDIRLYGAIRKSAYLINPPYWKGSIKLHVLLKGPKQTEDELLYKYALADLGMVDPVVAGLYYPETIELGWTDEPRR